MGTILDWEDVRVFLAVMRTGGFTGAARRLSMHQSTVSRRIGALEDQLGAELFVRTTRSCTPSELAGRIFPEAERVERAMTGLRRAAEATDEVAGHVRVASAEEVVSALLVPALGELRRAHPQLTVTLVGGGEVVDLQRGDADVALRAVRPSQGDLVSRLAATFHYAPFASRGYVRRYGSPRGAIRPLAELDWLVLDDPHGRLPEARWVADLLDHRNPILQTNNTLDLAAAAADGLGVALLPHSLARQHKNLTRVDGKDRPVMQRRLWLVAPRSLAGVKRVRSVMDWIARTCAQAA